MSKLMIGHDLTFYTYYTKLLWTISKCLKCKWFKFFFYFIHNYYTRFQILIQNYSSLLDKKLESLAFVVSFLFMQITLFLHFLHFSKPKCFSNFCNSADQYSASFHNHRVVELYNNYRSYFRCKSLF